MERIDESGAGMGRGRAYREYRERGTYGAASGVRHIDPSTYQVPIHLKVSERPKDSEKKVIANKADRLLKNDAYRRFGKRRGDRTLKNIKRGRYS
jgi:hypothetical protein